MGKSSRLSIVVYGVDRAAKLSDSDRVYQDKEYSGDCQRDMGVERDYHVKQAF